MLKRIVIMVSLLVAVTGFGYLERGGDSAGTVASCHFAPEHPRQCI